MKEIQKKSDYCYRFFNDDIANGILSCGFLSKSSSSDSIEDCTNEYYIWSGLPQGQLQQFLQNFQTTAGHQPLRQKGPAGIAGPREQSFAAE